MSNAETVEVIFRSAGKWWKLEAPANAELPIQATLHGIFGSVFLTHIGSPQKQEVPLQGWLDADKPTLLAVEYDGPKAMNYIQGKLFREGVAGGPTGEKQRVSDDGDRT